MWTDFCHRAGIAGAGHFAFPIRLGGVGKIKSSVPALTVGREAVGIWEPNVSCATLALKFWRPYPEVKLSLFPMAEYRS